MAFMKEDRFYREGVPWNSALFMKYDLEPSERYLSNARAVAFPQTSRGSIDDYVDSSAPGPGWYTISEKLVRSTTSPALPFGFGPERFQGEHLPGKPFASAQPRTMHTTDQSDASGW